MSSPIHRAFVISVTSVSVRSASHGNNAPGGPLQRLAGVVASE